MKTYKFNVYRKLMQVAFWIAVLGGSGLGGQVLANDISNIAVQRFNNWERASDTELGQLRGGFALPNGTNIDFSLERITSLNGSVVYSSSFQLPENVSLIQNGALNQAPELTMSGLGSVVQNNLDNQVIRTVTDVNIAVSHLKNLDLNNSGMIFNNFILPNAH
ncbi:hypothetical protein [Methylobacter sp.]|uniref:hypothetical protein n=1 Tax=Methylobacter sp. TaxID=2051955 RepID=UPI002488C491|nr:hypothetical protein [Methylobacter sp.]MDI1276457.1 hypothetical protein [Methylobacter sp.]MDI1359356.1 hypothetical protein [Methylobacter sp.]